MLDCDNPTVVTTTVLSLALLLSPTCRHPSNATKHLSAVAPSFEARKEGLQHSEPYTSAGKPVTFSPTRRTTHTALSCLNTRPAPFLHHFLATTQCTSQSVHGTSCCPRHSYCRCVVDVVVVCLKISSSRAQKKPLSTTKENGSGRPGESQSWLKKCVNTSFLKEFIRKQEEIQAEFSSARIHLRRPPLCLSTLYAHAGTKADAPGAARCWRWSKE